VADIQEIDKTQGTHHMNPRLLLFAVSLGVLVSGFYLLPFSSGTDLQRFTFVKIADTQDGVYRSFNRAPIIDDQGRVIFRADLSNGEQGIFVGDGNMLEQIASTTGDFKNFPRHPTMSRNGKIAFLTHLDDGNVAYFQGPSLANDLLFSDSTYEELGDIAINNFGTMAFKAKPPEGNDWRRRIFMGGTHRPLEVPESAHSQLGLPSINNNGIVAFSVGDEVWTSDGHTSQMISNSDDPYFLYSRPIINDAGVVVVQALLTDQEIGVEKRIVKLEGGNSETIVSTHGPFKEFFSHHSMNNDGVIVFSALLDWEEEGLFIGPNLQRDTIIARGDRLFGELIAKGGGPIISNQSINDAGQVTFFAQLENGTEGIFRADPTQPLVAYPMVVDQDPTMTN